MNDRKRRNTAILVLLGLLMLSFAASAGLSVGPLSVRWELSAGETETALLSVQNTGEETIDVLVSLHDWWRTPEGSLQILPQNSVTRSCAPWLLFAPTSLSLAPGESKMITLELAVPDEVDGETVEGDHWALLLVEENPRPTQMDETESVTGATEVAVSYAIKILQQDPATQNREAEVTNIELVQRDPLAVSIDYENAGNAHLQTTGVVEVLDVQGEAVRRFDIALFPTLPGERRVLRIVEAEGEEPLPVGTYLLRAIFDFGGEYLIQGGLPFEISPPSGTGEG